MEFHVFQDKAGRWRWRLVAKNRSEDRSVLAESAYGYSDKADCHASIEKFRSTSFETPVFED